MTILEKQSKVSKTVALTFSVLTAIILAVSPVIIDYKYAKGEGDILFLIVLISCTIIFGVTIHVQMKKYLEASLMSAVILSLLAVVGNKLNVHFNGAVFGDLSLIVAVLFFFTSLIASLVVGLPFYFTRGKGENST